jgi:drug/metabolite transporter (DMT)-like permease
MLFSRLAARGQWLMRSHDFHFPLTVTTIYMAMKLPLGFIATRCRETELDVGWRTIVRWIIPLALVTSVEIALSMCSYLFVSVTRITLVKSSAPAWQLLWGLLIGTERPSVRLIGVVALATGGLILATYARHPSTNPGRMEGILLIVSATCLQGLRGCMMQLTLRPTPGWLDVDSSRPDSAAPDAPIGLAPDPPTPMAEAAEGPDERACRGSKEAAANHAPAALLDLLPPADSFGPAEGFSPCACCRLVCASARERREAASLASNRNPSHIDPIGLVYLLSPWTTLFSALIMLALEGERLRDALVAGSDANSSMSGETLLMLLGAGTLVFCLVLIELRIVQLTSALTLSVAGAFKECITILGGHVILHDRMSPYNAAGLVCTLLGVHLYRLNRTSVDQ